MELIRSLPVCCNPTAFEWFKRVIPQIDSTDALLSGSLAIARLGMFDFDPEKVDRTLQKMADCVRSRVKSRNQKALLAHLHNVLFDEKDFAGNTDDYYNIANNFVPAVLETKRGLPVTLAIVYKTVAERIGLCVYGINLPGHFLAGVKLDESDLIIIDPFRRGNIVSKNEAEKIARQIFGDGIEIDENIFKPTSTRIWLTRILQNLLNKFGQNGKYIEVAGILEMEMLLWPREVNLQRDLGLIYARAGLSRQAALWLASYLSLNPCDPQRDDIEKLIDVLEE